MSTPYLFINDQFLSATEGSLHVSDLSIQRGYALFDYLKVVNGVPLYVEDHLDRLFHSAQQLHLPLTQTREALKDIIRQLMERNNLPQSGIRITLTGGYSPDGYSVAAPNLIIGQSPLQLPTAEAVQRGIKLMAQLHQRQLPHVKTTDYVMAIWLQPKLKEAGADDILYYNANSITECPRANLFMVKEGKLITPAHNILKGVIRKQVLQLAADILPVEERDISLQELKSAEEVFITSTTKQILPVNQVDDVVLFKKGPGRITAQLLHLLQEQQATQYKQAAAV